jgi:hypothetical protein
MTPEIDSFPPGVAGKLRTYVYRLIDPRNGETARSLPAQGNNDHHRSKCR